MLNVNNSKDDSEYEYGPMKSPRPDSERQTQCQIAQGYPDGSRSSSQNYVSQSYGVESNCKSAEVPSITQAFATMSVGLNADPAIQVSPPNGYFAHIKTRDSRTSEEIFDSSESI